MDIDRRRAEASEFGRKPRLIEENEIPPCIIEQSKRFTEEEERSQDKNAQPNSLDVFADAGRRRRKDINYSQVTLVDNWRRYNLKLAMYILLFSLRIYTT